MPVFQTTPEQIAKISSIMKDMKNGNLDEQFISEAARLAETDQGVFDLMDLWQKWDDSIVREAIVFDICDSLSDYKRPITYKEDDE